MGLFGKKKEEKAAAAGAVVHRKLWPRPKPQKSQLVLKCWVLDVQNAMR